MLSGFLRNARKVMTLRTVRIAAKRISHCAPGPAPKTIGRGPMKMIPPKLVEPSCESAVATVTSIRPRIINENSRMSRVRNFGGVSGSYLPGLAVWCVAIVVFSSFIWIRSGALGLVLSGVL